MVHHVHDDALQLEVGELPVLGVEKIERLEKIHYGIPVRVSKLVEILEGVVVVGSSGKGEFQESV
jgi:hypothetical protein